MLDSLAMARLQDARVLDAAGRHDGASYLCGYAVELALKARICKTLGWPDFPETSSEFHSYRTFQTHELEVLLRLSGQEARIRQHHFAEWTVVAIWQPESRYQAIGSVTPAACDAMIQAADALLKVL